MRAVLTIVVTFSIGCGNGSSGSGSGSSGSSEAKLRELRDRMCKCADKACTDAVDVELAKLGLELSALRAEVDRCRAKALDVVSTEDHAVDAALELDAATTIGSDLPVECGEYKAVIEKLASCTKVPETERDQMKRAYDNTSATWSSLSVDNKLALSTACKGAAAATRNRCGWTR